MNKSVHANDSLLATSESNLRSWGLFFIISLVSHIVLLIVIVYSSAYSPKSNYIPQIIDVDLSSFSPTPPVEKPPTKKQTVKKPEKVIHPKEKITKKTGKKIEVKDKTTKKEIEHKRSLKKQTYKSKKVVKEALKQLKNNVETTRPDPIKSALDKLRKSVAQKGFSKPSNKPGTGQPRTGRTGSGRPGFGFGNGRGTAGNLLEASRQQIYAQECRYKILDNWVFSEHMAGGRTDLEVVLIIAISAQGNMTKISTEKESGNSVFDDSVHRAVKKANPFPPLPSGMNHINIRVVFNPSDLKRE